MVDKVLGHHMRVSELIVALQRLPPGTEIELEMRFSAIDAMGSRISRGPLVPVECSLVQGKARLAGKSYAVVQDEALAALRARAAGIQRTPVLQKIVRKPVR